MDKNKKNYKVTNLFLKHKSYPSAATNHKFDGVSKKNFRVIRF
jgi:hypothetical protein